MEVLGAEGGGVGREGRRGVLMLLVVGPGGGGGGGGRGDGDGLEAQEAFEDEVADGGFLGVVGLDGLLEGGDEGREGGEGLEDCVEEACVAQIG